MIARLRRLHPLRDEAGATAIEFACLAGVLALMVLGIIDYGRAFWFRMEVQNAAQAGADWAQYNLFGCGGSTCTPTGLRNAVIYATDLAIGGGDVHVTASNGGSTCGCPTTATGVAMGQTCGSACTYGTATGYATVTVTYRFRPVFPWPGMSDPMPLSGSATAMCKGGVTC